MGSSRRPGGIIRAGRLALVSGLLVGVLAGCSMLRLAYGQADTLLFHAMDRYLDLDRTQAEAWRAATARWLAWHRREQLPQVLRGLDAMAQDWAGPQLGPERACQHLQRVQGWADEAVRAALPDLALLLPRLGPDQVAQLAERQREDRQRWLEERVEPPAEARQQRALERLQGRYERLLGPLTPAQRVDLLALVRQLDDPQRALAEQQRRQGELMAVVMAFARPGAPRAAARAEAVAATPSSLTAPGASADAAATASASARLAAAWRAWSLGPEATQAWQQAQAAAHCQFLSRLHASADTRQRSHALRQLAQWRADLQSQVLPDGAGLSAPAR